VLITSILVNFFTILVEITISHPTSDAKRTVKMITKGYYKNLFWGGVMIFGNILPLVLLLLMDATPMVMALTGIITIIGIYFTEKFGLKHLSDCRCRKSMEV